MSYCFTTVEQALYLLAQVDIVLPSSSDVSTTIREAIRNRAGTDILENPLDFNNLLTWSDTPQGSSFWEDAHTRLADFGRRFTSGEACIRWLESVVLTTPGTSAPSTFEIPTRGLARWVYDTCRAQTAARRDTSTSDLKPEEQELLRTWARELSNPTIKVFVKWALGAGLWSTSYENTVRILETSGGSYATLQMVVPLDGSDHNGHNYPIGKPVLMVHGQSGVRLGMRGVGNSLCSYNPDFIRFATDAEIDMFFQQTPRDKYMQFLDTYRERLGESYPMPEIPI
ncbi:MAG TPA: hypothetical protein VLH56_18720 [Dissulfurispiraceae bacterium]|nr:hypothetical protein [Dissulfurispiraceae bacterium]